MFFVSASVLINSVLCVILIFYSLLRGNVATTASHDEWSEWLNQYLVLLVWTIIFSLPFPQTGELRLSIFYSFFFITPALGYVIGFHSIPKLKRIKSTPQNISEMQNRINTRVSARRWNRIFRDLCVLMAMPTLFLLVNRYLRTANHFQNNSPLMFLSFGVAISVAILDFSAQEETLESNYVAEVYGENDFVRASIDPKDLHDILNMKMSHFFLMDCISRHSPIGLVELEHIYPNSRGQFRHIIKTLEKRLCEKISQYCKNEFTFGRIDGRGKPCCFQPRKTYYRYGDFLNL